MSRAQHLTIRANDLRWNPKRVRSVFFASGSYGGKGRELATGDIALSTRAYPPKGGCNHFVIVKAENNPK